jgi:hypothetical protein
MRQHNHIAQADFEERPEDCPACQNIRPWIIAMGNAGIPSYKIPYPEESREHWMAYNSDISNYLWRNHGVKVDPFHFEA